MGLSPANYLTLNCLPGWPTSEDAHPQCPQSSSDVQRENKIRDHGVRSSCGMGTESAGGIAMDMPGEAAMRSRLLGE